MKTDTGIAEGRTPHTGSLRAAALIASLFFAAAFSLSSPALSAGTTGELTQKVGTAGCISGDGTGGPSGGVCADGTGLELANSVAVSPDGKNAYAVSTTGYPDDAAIAVLDRAPSGALTQKAGIGGCLSRDGGDPIDGAGACAESPQLAGFGYSITVSPDGKNVYAITGSILHIFERDPGSGKLTRRPGTAGCISESGNPSSLCVDGFALSGARSVTVSPDGKNVYVAAQISDAVAVFDRDPANGDLAQKPPGLGCISEAGSGPCAEGVALLGARSVTVSPDGEHVYVPAQVSDAIAIFDRDPNTGALNQAFGVLGCISESGDPCAEGRALEDVFSVVVSADGRHAYAASPTADAASIFNRDPTTGALAQQAAGCITSSAQLLPPFDECVEGYALEEATTLAVSADDETVYVSARGDDAVAVFDRNKASGTLTQKAGSAGCVTDDGSSGACADGVALYSARSVAVSPDDKSVYVASAGSDAVAIFDRETPPPITPPVKPPADTTIEGSAKAKKKQKQKRNRIVLKAKVKAQEDLRAKAKGKVKVKKKSYRLKPQTKSISEGKKKRLKLKPKKRKHAKKIVRALKKGKRAKAKLTVKMTDAAGNKKSQKLKVKLKR